MTTDTQTFEQVATTATRQGDAPDTAALTLHPMMLENVEGIVFDLDGTLINSAADILHGMRLAFDEAGIGRLPDDYFPDDLHGTGAGIIRSIIADMGWAMPADVDALHRLYVKHYTNIAHAKTRLYDDVDAILDACRQAGLRLGICTNKMRANALTAMQKTGILSQFAFVTGCDTWAEAKPSPVPLLETMRMLDLEPGQCLYFGDTSVDAQCAQAAGVRFVLHEAGYGDAALDGLPQHFAFRHWRELAVTPVEEPQT